MNLINTTHYNGYPIQSQKGELQEEILNAIDGVTSKAILTHPRTTAMRFDLKFPADYPGPFDIISKFFDALRARIKTDIKKKSLEKKRRVSCDLNYVWVLERGENPSKGKGWHYHVVIYLNHDVYNSFGKFNSEKDNMYSRILASWASALGISIKDATGLVHIPNNPIYHLNLGLTNLNYEQEIQALLYRLSYFAKMKTKPYGEYSNKRFWGTSSRASETV